MILNVLVNVFVVNILGIFLKKILMMEIMLNGIKMLIQDLLTIVTYSDRMAKAKIAIIFYSTWGHIYKMAQEVAKGMFIYIYITVN